MSPAAQRAYRAPSDPARPGRRARGERAAGVQQEGPTAIPMRATSYGITECR